ncbi:MAG: hypothetical protein MJA29_03220 [Candidatus Omnitrophica bacterium]|nr:hypothetical protein [Candidatus Omnitrophota bacterium]
MNNLYGTAMVQSLPIRNFHWLSREEINKIIWENVSETNYTGYILEVDLDYPPELHDSHNNYPLAPEKMKIINNMLSPYCQEMKGSLGIINGIVSKLVPTLQHKKQYILHYRNLQLYLQLGMKLRYIHRVISFHQAP